MHKWRFGYGSNIGLKTLKQKKNLNVSRYLVGTIKGWELYFMPGFQYVEPGWAAIRPHGGDGGGDGGDGQSGGRGEELHGSAFLIPNDEADGLDRQEGGYNVLPVTFTSYDGEVVEQVGLYIPKKEYIPGSPEGEPSLRYLKLLKDGAKEGNLAQHWIEHLKSFPHYVTPSEVRFQTQAWIFEFHNDDDRKDQLWTVEKLAKHDGSNPELFPPHTSIMGYVIQINPKIWVFSSWKGHNITRRNLLQFNGKSLDTGDIRHDEPGYRPLPKLSNCSEGEREYLMQSLESQLHRGSVIVAQLDEFLSDQK